MSKPVSILVLGGSESDRERINGLIKISLENDGFRPYHLRELPMSKNFVTFEHGCDGVPDIDLASANTDLDMYQVLFKISQSKKQKA
jgi:hypothetical protein